MAEWHHTPPVPVQVSPLFRWPLRPLEILRWYVGSWFWVSEKLLIAAIAAISWLWLTPSMSALAAPDIASVAAIWMRNIILMTCVAGGLHLWFYHFAAQGKALKYDPRDLSSGRMFTLGGQTRDNMFWTLASGVTVWTLYEVILLWALAAGYAPRTTFAQTPLWFIAVFFLIPIWESFWFYWIHRALHWRPLYKLAHHIHHRNSNIGPWSGLSMHPVEHVMFLGGVCVHWLIASHPIHIIFHLQYYTLSAATTHCGFEGLMIRNEKRLNLGTYHHQMHHRYFECNYGSLEMPWDKLFGSFHDGTDAGRKQMIERRKRLGKKLGGE